MIAILLAAQLTNAQVQQRVETYLGTIDTPIAAAQWEELGSRGADLLEPIARSSSELPSRRAKAMGGLVHAAPERAARLAATLVNDEKAPLTLRLAAVHGLSAKELRPVMENAKAMHVRAAAAEAIAASGDCAAVKARVSREPAEVRGAFRRALSKCGSL
jgi:hypothetical protein